jgi:hypothetical protein
VSLTAGQITGAPVGYVFESDSRQSLAASTFSIAARRPVVHNAQRNVCLGRSFVEEIGLLEHKSEMMCAKVGEVPPGAADHFGASEAIGTLGWRLECTDDGR